MTEQDIFLAALEIADPAQRTDYLDRTCAGNPKLRRQVETLLAAQQRSGEFLDVPALQQIAAAVAPPADHPPVAGAETSAEHQAGKEEIELSFLQPFTRPGSLGRLGHYEVEQVIGRGGCGIVLKAFDERLERVVAIKVLAPELAATSPARKRFLREARAAAAIRQENVIAIHAVEDQPIPFLVMEYIAGQTLQQRLDQTGPLEVAEVLRIGQQIAHGLEAAHALGLIHRDIKPGNILLEGEPGSVRAGSLRVKITDFGLARTADDASVTQSGAVVGTPLYMSPEQSLGEMLDPRSDLFSLGSVLYVMCSGRPPFRAPTAMAVLRRVAQDAPRPIQEIIPEVPEWLSALIARLHAKKPADRFASAKEVADLLGRCLLEWQQQGRVEAVADLLPMRPGPETAADKAVPDEPASAEARDVHAPASRPAHRRSHRWAAAAAILATLLAGLGLSEATGVTNVGGTVIRLFSPEGTLVVEVDDPGVSVSIDGEEMVITGTGAKEIRLKPGQYKVQASKDGKVMRQELVTVTKNGRQVVRVSREANLGGTDPDRSAAEWVLREGGDVTILAGQPEQKLLVNAVKDLPAGPFKLISFNRNAASRRLTSADLDYLQPLQDLCVFWLGRTELSDADLGRLAQFPAASQYQSISLEAPAVTDAGLAKLAPLPTLNDLRLTRCRVTDAGLEALQSKAFYILWLDKTPGISDAGLPKLRGLKVRYIHLGGNPNITDAGLKALAGITGLTSLSLPGTPISDAGLPALEAVPELEHLDLGETRVTDAGLRSLARLPKLRTLWLIGLPVTDAGLEHLKALTNLQVLRLATTKVTKAGVESLAAALPACKIDWDGGVIEPTAGQKAK